MTKVKQSPNSTGEGILPTTSYDVIETAAGWVGIEVGSRGVKRLSLPSATAAQAAAALDIGEKDITPGASGTLGQRLRDYFVGKPVVFKEELDLAGATRFQKEVYQATCSIPYGQTLSYAELAAKIGRPKAAHAVGQALGTNPIPLLIPCHRVISADGGPGGFSGGVETKRKLIKMEKSKH